MKNVFTSALLLIVGVFSVNAAGTETDPVKAGINDQMQITLPADQPLAEWYVVDVTSMHFANKEVMEQFCTNFSDNNLKLTGNFADNKITIMVPPLRDSVGNYWNVERWNSYLAGRAPKMMFYMDTMNK